MGYHMPDGKYADTLDVVLLPAQSLAAGTTNTTGRQTGRRRTACLTLVATGGSGTLDVTVQTSADGTTWRSAGAFAQLTGAGSERKSFPGLDRHVRLSCAVATGPFTGAAVTGDLV